MKELKGIKNNTVIHCPTKELSYKVVEEILHKAGVYTNHTTDGDWHKYGKDMCYFVSDLSHCNLGYFKGGNYEIITAEEFIKLNTETKMKKEEIAVRIDTPEQAKRAYQILTDANEVMANPRALAQGNRGGINCKWIELYGESASWCRVESTNKTKITLDELEELLGVKRGFKVGDRVRCVAGFTDSYADNYGGSGYVEGEVFEVNKININTIDSAQTILWGAKNSCGVYAKAVELVTEPKKVEAPKTLSISRANLKRVYDAVCFSWKDVITKTIAKHNQFDDEIVFDLEVVRQGYREANDKQGLLLKEVFPLPTVKKTIEVTRWVNIHSNVGNTIFNTKESALGAVTGFEPAYSAIAVEMKGSYTTEVRDEVEDILPF